MVIKTRLAQWPPYRAWLAFRDFSKKSGVNPLGFLPPIFLALMAALAEGTSVGLLIPTIHGVTEKNFSFIRHKPVLGQLVAMLPDPLPKSDAAIFTLLVVLIFFFGVAKSVFFYLQAVMTSFQVREFANKIRKMIYGRYLGFGKTFFDRASHGHLHQILVGYTQQVAQELQIVQSALFQIFSLIIYASIAFYISWKLTLFSGIVFPILHYSLRVLIRRIKRSSEAFSVAYNEMGSKISNALSCIMLVKAYTNESREKKWFDFSSDRVRSVQCSIDKKQRLIGPFQEVVGLCMTLLLVGLMAFLLVHEKTGGVAGFLVFFIVLRKASQGFGSFNTIQSTLAGIRGPLQEIGKIFDDRDKFVVPEGNKIFGGLQDRIEFKDLNFCYVEGRPVLTHLNLSVGKNEVVAIVGSSGSGKTTLAHLLMRFYDVSPGSIFIDGMDFREFTLSSLRNKIALVSQDTFLLNASFKINFLYGLKREVPEAELQSVLEQARLAQLVKLVGLEAQIGERGVKLSGGERQRVSIARAILKNPEILLLDEATSALDTVTEGLIQDALNEVVKNKTTIVIAHRLSTIQHADRIIVLERGRNVEAGTFEQLLANKEGYFYSYWQKQKMRGESKES